ncbi:hypothetical protein B566_EDAN011118 [Ephemera danica]|nr:hypothetical protein B566_EDAN011118 [Ephemera danica]
MTCSGQSGDTLEDVTPPAFNSAQATALAWHPCRKVLAVGWENGALKLWLEDQTEFTSVHAPHTASIPYLYWSSRGNRLVSADTSGTVVAWKADSRGSLQILYQVELKDTPCCIVYKSAIDALDIDISGLAKAAVAGDEQALDLFSVVYYFNEQGSVKEIANESSAIKRLLYHATWSHLLVLTENLNVVQYLVETDDQLTEKARLKLTGRLEDAAMVWAGPSLLAVSTGELSIRCLNLESGENFLLTMDKIITSPSAREFFICLDFNPTRNILCGGTNLGSVALWKFMPSSNTDAEDNWHLQVHNKLTGSAIQHIQWGMVGSLFVLHTVCEIYFMREQHICASYSTDISAVQVAPNQLSVDLLNSEGHMELCCDMQIKGVFVSSEYIVIWGSKRLVVYEIHQQSKHLKVVGSFACECSGAVIYGQSIYCIDGNNIYVRTIQGTIKQTFACLGEEGEPIGLELCSHFLTVTTLLGYIKIMDLSRREAKLHVKPKNMNDVIRDFGEIILARSNSAGNKVSVTVARSNLLPDPRLYLWDIETDEVTHFNFATGDLEQKTSIVTTSMDLSGRFAVNHFWDVEEPKLLVCEAKLLPQPKDKMKQRLRYSTNSKPPPENKVYSTFSDQL